MIVFCLILQIVLDKSLIIKLNIQIDADSSGTVTSGVYGAGNQHIIIKVEYGGNFTSVDELFLYINGNQEGSYSDSWINRNDALTSDKNYIYNNEGNGRFVGAVSVIRLWNRALTDSEINEAFIEIPDPDIAYIKRSGVYQPASKMFKKENNIWVEVTDATTLCDENTKYVLHD